MVWTNPDERLCDCRHPWREHSRSLKRRLPCMFRGSLTDRPCRCDDFTLTIPATELSNLPGRLTEEDIVSRRSLPRAYRPAG